VSSTLFRARHYYLYHKCNEAIEDFYRERMGAIGHNIIKETTCLTPEMPGQYLTPTSSFVEII
jgi:hypothetical protein